MTNQQYIYTSSSNTNDSTRFPLSNYKISYSYGNKEYIQDLKKHNEHLKKINNDFRDKLRANCKERARMLIEIEELKKQIKILENRYTKFDIIEI